MKTIKVKLDRSAANSYDIHIGDGIMDRMGLILARSQTAQRYVIVTDDHVDAVHGGRVQAALEKADLAVDRLAVAPGETTKDIRTVLAVAEKLAGLGADRHTALIALGGGVVGDLTGFVASIYMRGIPVLQVPTTLLAQVDSSIGGKTGVDIAAGKNLLGTFHQPKGVFIDVDFLRMLPEAQLRSGFAEVIKCAAIESPELLDDIEAAAAKGGLQETDFLERIIAATCLIKKGLVEIDERDRGLRRILNFGHTVGHAVEAASGYALSHGESVAVGMVAASVISERMHYLPAGDRERIESVIRAVGLPDRIPGKLSPDEIIARLASDKKKEGETIHFILLKKLGFPFVNGGVPEDIVRETIKRLQK